MKKILLGLVLGFFLSQPAVFASDTQTKTESKTTEVTLTKDNTIYLNTYVYGSSVAKVMSKVLDMNTKLSPGAPIYLVIDSGGGSIQAGLEMIDFLSDIDRPVHTITLWAASMAFHTVQGLSSRYILKDGTLMSHKARGGFYGEFPGQLDSRYSRYLKRLESMNKRVVDRTNGKYTLESYDTLVENEYWCDGQDCVDAGFADEVVNAKCDKSLSGIRKEVVDRMLLRKKDSKSDLDFHVIEFVDVYSECPLITGYLNWNIYIDGKPTFNLNLDSSANENMSSINTGEPELDEIIKSAIKKRQDSVNTEGKSKAILVP